MLQWFILLRGDIKLKWRVSSKFTASTGTCSYNYSYNFRNESVLAEEEDRSQDKRLTNLATRDTGMNSGYERVLCLSG
jgi:hypothetical protein